MMAGNSGYGTLWPMLIYFAGSVLLTAVMLILSHLLGPRHNEPATGQYYEGGVTSSGTARLRFSVKFYLVAMFFVVFDLESVFIVAWSVALKEVGWTGYLEALVFILVLVATLIYLWRLGALDIVRKKVLRNASGLREGDSLK